MFSKAEVEVAKLLCQGLCNKQIADRLFVSEKTIKYHLTNIYDKSGCFNRTQFITMYLNDFKNNNNEDNMQTLPNNVNYVAPATNNHDKSNDLTNRDKINFIDQKFKIGTSIDQLHTMMVAVTEKEMNAANVNAACNCVSRINETINTAIQAARFLSGR